MQQESRVVEEALDGIFGEQCLQLGLWGGANRFLKHARTQRTWLIDEGLDDGAPAAVGEFHRLPVQDDSIDCVILPHVLDYSDRPHAILREVAKRTLEAGKELTSANMKAALEGIKDFDTGGLIGVPISIKGNSIPVGRIYRADTKQKQMVPASDWIVLQ